MKLEVIISVYLNTVFIYFVPFLLYPDALHELVWSLPARPEGQSPSAPGLGMTLAEHRWHAGASSQFHLFYAFVYRYHLPLRANQGAAGGRTPHPCILASPATHAPFLWHMADGQMLGPGCARGCLLLQGARRDKSAGDGVTVPAFILGSLQF